MASTKFCYSPVVNGEAWSDTVERRPQQTRHYHTQRAQLSSLTKILLAYCVLATTLLLAVVIVAFANVRPRHCSGSSTPAASGRFGRSWAYMSLDSQHDHLWNDLEADGDSVVITLPDSTSDRRNQSAVIAMQVSAVCRQKIPPKVAANSGQVPSAALLVKFCHALQQAHQGIDPGFDWRDNDHWPHCLDYMRKSILCAADDTVETPPTLRNGTIAPFIDGSQQVRQCGNSRKLIDLMKSHGKMVTTQPFP
ncbi:hypothetical protein IF1G_10735 [Cordyceps javanica]|uniref:Uncharacterized protein n=1 Tax=Cordyceps javanica TaxID=43265 RepID=A0A545UMA7_9HYPO|nr:hypothetical protein IF1G_10735 [Cordyceps javanica]TQW02031.1 hypothetical protein IF2G_10431 [Cordyceps javanica]